MRLLGPLLDLALLRLCLRLDALLGLFLGTVLGLRRLALLGLDLLLGALLRLAQFGLGTLLCLCLATLPGNSLLLRDLLRPRLALGSLPRLRSVALLRLPGQYGCAILLLPCGRLLRRCLLMLCRLLLLALRL